MRLLERAPGGEAGHPEVSVQDQRTDEGARAIR